MGTDEGDHRYPRPVFGGPRLLVQKGHGLARDGTVILGVRRLPWSGVVMVGPIFLQDHRVVAQQAQQCATVGDMHGSDLAVETGRVGLGPKVQLADRCDAVALELQPMPPRRHRTLIAPAVVPIAGLVHVASGGDGRAGRHADRRIAIGSGKTCPARRQPVEVGGLNDLAALAAECARRMLVGKDEKHVLRFHRIACAEPSGVHR